MEYEPFKAARSDYHPAAFYYHETKDELSRYVSWAPSLTKVFQTMMSMVSSFPDGLEVLLKKLDKDDKWHRHYGQVSKAELLTILKKHKSYLLQDGTVQICIRIIDTDEYIALDEHGVLFYYTQSREHDAFYRKRRYELKREKLIFSKPHWQMEVNESEKKHEALIADLKLGLTR